uniref:CSON006756 protein n=1 Tax=Culicoides sonorensis TaxID=179676 RepID=A0A336MVV1_CULSO
MTLNMKTYKGFNKNPYCEAHVPKAKATTIAETPEFKRIAENTKIQSNVKYHADFEKQKGKVTQVADDPETLRLRQNTKNISNVAYHGDLQKKAAMEKQREFGEVVDNKVDDHNESEYFSETLAAESLPHYQPAASTVAPTNVTNTTSQQQQQNYQQHQPIQQQQQQQQPRQPSPGGMYQAQNIQQRYYDQYENYARPNPNNSQQNYTNNNHHVTSNHGNNGYYNNGQGPVTNVPPTAHHQPISQQQHQQQAYHNSTGYAQQQQQQQQNYHNSAQNYAQQPGYYGGNNSYPTPTGNGYGSAKITDYDPIHVNDATRNAHHGMQRTSHQTNERSGVQHNMNQNRTRTNEVDPTNGYYGGVPDQQAYYQQQQQQQQPPKQHKPMSKVRVYRALYAYEAQDDDEVSFKEGDLIFEMSPIEGGWLTGRVESTGKSGMLPANYVEQAVI